MVADIRIILLDNSKKSFIQLDEKDKQIAETDELLSASIKMLASAGISNEQIAQQLNISVEKVEALMAS